ncbi:hypothetical protein BAE44_0013681, partial [Dichanthelium oligosanthes]
METTTTRATDADKDDIRCIPDSMLNFVFCRTRDEPIIVQQKVCDCACSLRKFVIAVEMNTVMHLKFKADQKGLNSDNAVHHCSFKAKLHGFASHQIKLELAAISVKVTWRRCLFNKFL